MEYPEFAELLKQKKRPYIAVEQLQDPLLFFLSSFTCQTKESVRVDLLTADHEHEIARSLGVAELPNFPTTLIPAHLHTPHLPRNP